MKTWLLKTSLEDICGKTSISFADFLQTGYNSKLPKNPAKILVYFLTSQKSLMLVFYIFGFYMILLILTVIVLLMLYCFDFMPWFYICDIFQIYFFILDLFNNINWKFIKKIIHWIFIKKDL